MTASYGMPFDFIAFFWIFSYIIDEHSYLDCCIFTKLSQIICLMCTFWFICIPNVTAGYGRFSDLIAFFGHFYIFLHVLHVITSSNFYKLCVNSKMWDSFLKQSFTIRCTLSNNILRSKRDLWRWLDHLMDFKIEYANILSVICRF